MQDSQVRGDKRDVTRTALAIRHVAFEDLGSFEIVLGGRGYAIAYAEAGIDALDGIDPLAPDLVAVLGGPIGACEDALYPFLADELRLIERRLAAGRPVLGICLGAQLMARALGAPVYAGPRKEIGWAPLTLTGPGGQSCLGWLAPEPPTAAGTAPVLHWHGDTFDLPDGAVLLASTGICPNQAFAWGRRALALQFHAEAAVGGFERWLIGHACEIAATEGIGVARLRADTARWGPDLEARARRCLAHWLDDLQT